MTDLIAAITYAGVQGPKCERQVLALVGIVDEPRLSPNAFHDARGKNPVDVGTHNAPCPSGVQRMSDNISGAVWPEPWDVLFVPFLVQDLP